MPATPAVPRHQLPVSPAAARAFDAALATATTAEQLARNIAATVMELAFPVDTNVAIDGNETPPGEISVGDLAHDGHHGATREEEVRADDPLRGAPELTPAPITMVVQRVVELACAHAASVTTHAAPQARDDLDLAFATGGIGAADAASSPSSFASTEPARVLNVQQESRVHMHHRVASLHVAMPGEIGLDVRLRLQGNNLFLDVKGPRATELAAAAPQLASALAAQGLKLQALDFGPSGSSVKDPQDPNPESEETARSLRHPFTRNPRRVRA
jgi:hypothetical protein